MKHSRRPWVRLAVLAMFVLAALSTASAQSLHDKWFKVLVKADTSRLNPVNGNFSSYKFQFYIYVHLEYIEPGISPRGAHYRCVFWTKFENGMWGMAMVNRARTHPFSENFFPQCWIRLHTEKGDALATYVSLRIVATPTTNSFSAAGDIWEGYDINGKLLFGWLTMTGRIVPRPKWAVG